VTFSFPKGFYLLFPSSATFNLLPGEKEATFTRAVAKDAPSDSDKINRISVTNVTETKDEGMMGDGEGYRGTQNKSTSGNRCLKWTDESPNIYVRRDAYPGRGLGDHNYCRNPDGYSTIWCYTEGTDERWEACQPL